MRSNVCCESISHFAFFFSSSREISVALESSSWTHDMEENEVSTIDNNVQLTRWSSVFKFIFFVCEILSSFSLLLQACWHVVEWKGNRCWELWIGFHFTTSESLTTINHWLAGVNSNIFFAFSFFRETLSCFTHSSSEPNMKATCFLVVVLISISPRSAVVFLFSSLFFRYSTFFFTWAHNVIGSMEWN